MNHNPQEIIINKEGLRRVYNLQNNTRKHNDCQTYFKYAVNNI